MREVAVSDFMLARMREQPHARRVCRIPNGIDPATPAPSLVPCNTGRPFLVGFAGRLVPGKGADHLISAFAQVRERLPAKLLFAGDGPERARLDGLAHDAGLAADIEFLGVVEDVGALWSRCDVAVFPSQTLPESFGRGTRGNVVLQARRCNIGGRALRTVSSMARQAQSFNLGTPPVLQQR